MDHPNLPFGFALPGHSHPPIPPTANMLGPNPSGHPGPTASPPQSVPGRRTPLGSVGLGGFYAQGLGMMPPGDENKPDSGAILDKASPNLMMAPSTSNTGSGSSAVTGLGAGSSAGGGNSGGGSSGGGGGKQKNRQGKTVRLNINARLGIVNNVNVI